MEEVAIMVATFISRIVVPSGRTNGQVQSNGDRAKNAATVTKERELLAATGVGKPLGLAAAVDVPHHPGAYPLHYPTVYPPVYSPHH